MRSRSKIIPGTSTDRPREPVDDVKALVDLIQMSAGKVVVVVGPRNSGITRLIREQVLPQLEPPESTAFFDCATYISEEALEAVSRPNLTVILDSFDRFLRLPESVQKPGLEAIFSDRRRATVVLIADKQSLADFFELREFDPDILKRLFELPELNLGAELQRYCPPSGATVLSWEPGVIKALEDDLARLSDSTVTPRLVEIIDEGFRVAVYDQDRGLIGLLEKHLKQTLMRLVEEPGFGRDAEDVALAILKEMAAQGQSGKVPLEEMAKRMDVPADMVSRCHRWLIETSGLIKESAADELVFQPPQLAFVLAKLSKEDRESCVKAERYLANGIEDRNKIGALLSREQFREIEAQRTLLRTSSEQASFLLQFALSSDPDRDPGPVNYWLCRISDPALEINALGEALVDPSFKARRRAASLLARLDEPRVHGHLCRAALEDASEDVRREAVKSLSTFANKGPIREVLTRAALKGKGEVRIRAIQALYIFQDDECAHLLQDIVGSEARDDERWAAINALARTRCEAGVSALVRIALHDADKKDRDWAAAALAGLDREDLIEFGLNAVFQDWTAVRPAKDGKWWKKLGHWPAALLIAMVSFFIHGLPVLIFRRWFAAAAFLAVEAACYAAGANNFGGWWVLWLLNWSASVAAGAWAARRWVARHKTRPGSFYHVLSNAFLANTMLSGGLLVHGLGHWITGRKRQAWQMMGAEAVAVLAFLTTLPLGNFFNLGIARDLIDQLTIGLFYVFRYGGVALSWLWAVSSLTMEERWGRARPWSTEEHSGVLRALLKAPGSAPVLRRSLVGEPSIAHAARQLLGRLGDSVPGAALLSVVEHDAGEGKRAPREILMCLARHKEKKGYETVISEAGELLARLPAGQRSQLVDVLARHPTEASVRCLFERRAVLRPWNRIRLIIAMVIRPFHGWNRTVRLASLAAAFLAVLLAVDGCKTNSNPGWPQIKELRRLSTVRKPEISQDVATIAQFLAVRYPSSSATELKTIFQEQIGNKNCAPGLAMGLGWLATSHSATNDAKVRAEKRAREIAVNTLINAMAETNNAGQVAGGAETAIQNAVKRGGSTELVNGLARLLEKPSFVEAPSGLAGQGQNAQLLQGRVAAMLASLAKASTETPAQPTYAPDAQKAIAKHVGALEALLRISAIKEVKKAALDALEASASNEAVGVIKNFILSEAIPMTPAQPSGTQAVNPARARETDDLVRMQRETRIAAVDSLREIQNPTAETALEDLMKMSKAGLPPELAEKLEAPFGHEAAVKLDNQARTLLLNGEMNEALKKARAAVDADKDYAEARGTLGSVLYQLKERDGSLKEFRLATEIDPEYSWAYYMQGVILNDQGKPEEALEVLGKVVEINPSYPWTYRLLAQILVDRDFEKEAVELLHQYAKLSPGVGEIYMQLAYIYHEHISRADRAAYQLTYDALQKAIEIFKDGDPDQALSAEMNFAESELTTGRYQDLIERAPGLLERVGANANRIMALDVLRLSAQILQNDNQAAMGTLKHLEDIYGREFKDTGKWHEWIYDGTVLYMEKYAPTSERTTAMLELLRSVESISSDHRTGDRPPVIRQESFDAIRRVLDPSRRT